MEETQRFTDEKSECEIREFPMFTAKQTKFSVYRMAPLLFECFITWRDRKEGRKNGAVSILKSTHTGLLFLQLLLSPLLLLSTGGERLTPIQGGILYDFNNVVCYCHTITNNFIMLRIYR